MFTFGVFEKFEYDGSGLFLCILLQPPPLHKLSEAWHILKLGKQKETYTLF